MLLTAGTRLSAYGADDAHFQPQDPPGCAAWVQVRAESLDPQALVAALKDGHFCASTGPEIHPVTMASGQITVGCSTARTVLVTGGTPGKQVRDGEDLTEVSLPLEMFAGCPYIRVTVAEARGRAWTSPIWLR